MNSSCHVNRCPLDLCEWSLSYHKGIYIQDLYFKLFPLDLWNTDFYDAENFLLIFR